MLLTVGLFHAIRNLCSLMYLLSLNRNKWDKHGVFFRLSSDFFNLDKDCCETFKSYWRSVCFVLFCFFFQRLLAKIQPVAVDNLNKVPYDTYRPSLEETVQEGVCLTSKVTRQVKLQSWNTVSFSVTKIYFIFLMTPIDSTYY